MTPNHEELIKLGLQNMPKVHWNLNPLALVQETIEKEQGKITATNALAIDTGEFTGRSPQDRFIVVDGITNTTVWWGDINIKFSPEDFDALYSKVISYLDNKEIYVKDAYACADPEYRLNLRVITELPWSSLFAHNMFLRPTEDELVDFTPEWHVICAPGFKANPKIDKTRQHNFAIINFTKKIVLIGGTGYTGEIKKSIFSVLNYTLPQEKGVLTMHCSANQGKAGDTALFFGLSGTGKTVLAADPDRALIGDDEHGWTNDTIFNMEGGCYAKCFGLSKEKEPQIFNAIQKGALLENISFYEGTNQVNFENTTKTENTRVSYPMTHIDNICELSIAPSPKHIFFLSCDALGVLPPISKLTQDQAIYYFISGYTAKIAGTEVLASEPTTTFSACFGAPFMPLHPTVYAELLKEKIQQYAPHLWLVNTGWSGGMYGVGKRIPLQDTRAMLKAVLHGDLDNVKYEQHPIFDIAMPLECSNVSRTILNPKNTWADKNAYDSAAMKLKSAFIENFKQFSDKTNSKLNSVKV